MGEILGIGTTHAPQLMFAGDAKNMPGKLPAYMNRALERGAVPANWTDSKNWPEPLRNEWGEDEAASFGIQHRVQLLNAFHKIRDALDDFKPDLVLIYGDDQYENFNDDLVPPFAVYAYDEFEMQPLMRQKDGNPWGEPVDKIFKYKGHREAGVYLTNALMSAGFDVAYAYRPLHAHGLAHAHTNTLVFLDDDRRGWNYPVLPIHINCHGDRFVRNRATGGVINDHLPADPSSPTPERCFELGRIVARAFFDSPWRVAIIGSASWSHGGLTAKNQWVYPDVEADRELLQYMLNNDYLHFRDLNVEDIENSGQQEIRDWCALLGGMYELGHTTQLLEWAESWTYNSTKVMALFPANEA